MKLRLMTAIAIAVVSASGSVSAGTRDDILSRAARCGAISDDHTWLNCYYGAAQPMRAQLGLPPAPESQTLLVPSIAVAPAPTLAPNPAATPRRDNEGLLAGLFGGSVVLARVPATAYTFDLKGIFRISLADGSVWQQVEDDDSFASWREPARHYLVSIKTGSLGSYNLEVQGDNRSYKVRRLR
jgi:hypothetical protein